MDEHRSPLVDTLYAEVLRLFWLFTDAAHFIEEDTCMFNALYGKQMMECPSCIFVWRDLVGCAEIRRVFGGIRTRSGRPLDQHLPIHGAFDHIQEFEAGLRLGVIVHVTKLCRGRIRFAAYSFGPWSYQYHRISQWSCSSSHSLELSR